MTPATRRLTMATLAVAVLSSGVTWLTTRPSPPPPLPMEALTVTLDPTQSVVDSTLSPDGRTLVFAAIAHGQRSLHVRRLDQRAPRPLPATDGARQPFFSPDGQRVGFVANGALKWVALDGAASGEITRVDAETAGAAWGPDDQIVYSLLDGQGLRTVSVGGDGVAAGPPTSVTTLDPEDGELAHGWPHFVADGQSLIFTVARADRDPRLAWISLTTGDRTLLAPADGGGFVVDSGHLVYARRGEVFAMPVDIGRRAPVGPTRVVTAGVTSSAAGHGRLGRSSLSASRRGRLTYVEATPALTTNHLVWVDRHGAMVDIDGVSAVHQSPRLSVDGTHLVTSVRSDTFSRDLWVVDLRTARRRQLTVGSGDNHSPIWAPDDGHVTFASNRDGPQRIYQTAIEDPSVADTLVSGDGRTPGSWSSDGRQLYLHEWFPDRGRDIWRWTFEGDGRADQTLVVGTEANERAPAVSPDGRWLAYVSDISDGDQVYLRSAPGPGATRLSLAGGTEPVWSRDGTQLFYRRGRDLHQVDVNPDTGETSEPRFLFSGSFVTDPGGHVASYDVTRDGTRFVMLRPSASTSALQVLSHWQFVVFSESAP